MTIVGVGHTIRTALAAQITDGGVNCLPYDTWTRNMGAAAALSVTTNRRFAKYNGNMALRSMSLGVLCYIIVSADVKASVRKGEEMVERVVEAIGGDTTLGYKVTEVEIDGESTADLYRDDNGQMLVVVELPVTIGVLPVS